MLIELENDGKKYYYELKGKFETFVESFEKSKIMDRTPVFDCDGTVVSLRKRYVGTIKQMPYQELDKALKEETKRRQTINIISEEEGEE